MLNILNIVEYLTRNYYQLKWYSLFTTSCQRFPSLLYLDGLEEFVEPCFQPHSCVQRNFLQIVGQQKMQFKSSDSTVRILFS